MINTILYIPCGLVNFENINKTIEIKGFVYRIRNHGNVIFIDLRDKTGLIQVVFDPSINKEVSELSNKLKNESVVTIHGKVIKRDEKTVNNDLLTGNFEVLAEKLIIHNIANNLPFQINDESIEIDEELRLTYRYLDLRKPSS